MRTSTLILATCAFVPASFAQLVINEVDYDQIGTDTTEYLELKNISDVEFYPMQYVRVVLVNGNSGTPVIYTTVESPSWQPLAAGEYFLLCADPLAGCDALLTPESNAIQNGDADAIVLINVTDSTIIDALSYEGTLAGAVEGTGTSVGDDNVTEGRSIGRWPDGSDTDDNDTDFARMCSTPGTTNQGDTLDCSVPTVITERSEGPSLLAFLDAAGATLWMHTTGVGPVTFEVLSMQGAVLARRTVGDGRTSWAWNVNGAATGMVVVRATSSSGSVAQRLYLP